jgi:hypothetical protein
MSEEEKNVQGQKPKLCWMVVASPILILVGYTALGIFSGGLKHIPLMDTLGVSVFILSVLGALVLSAVGCNRIHKSQGRQSGQLYAVLSAVLAMFIIIWFFIPPKRPSIDQLKWKEGKAITRNITSAIRAYAAEEDPNGELPADNDFDALELKVEYLDGIYFNQSTDKMFSFTVFSLNPLRYTITVENKDLEPSTMTLDQDGTWTEKAE